jgi:hypothetical protein
MSDLVGSLPSFHIDMYICAQSNRKSKVLAEIKRPTFSRLRLSEKCRFISFEELEELMNASEKVLRNLNKSVLDDISEPLNV